MKKAARAEPYGGGSFFRVYDTEAIQSSPASLDAPSDDPPFSALGAAMKVR